MKFLTLPLFLFFASHFAAAQLVADPVALSEKTLDSLLFNGLYLTAKPVAQAHLVLVKKTHGEQSQAYVRALVRAAKVFPEIGMPHEADSCLSLALRICRAAPAADRSPELYLEAMLLHVYTRLALAQFDSAAATCERARLFAEQNFPPQHPLHADVTFYSAFCQHNYRNYAAGEPLFKKAMEQYDACGEPCIRKKTWALYYQIAMWSNAGQNQKALAESKKSVELCRRVFGDEHPHVGRAMLGVALYTFRLGNLEQAEEVYLQTLPLLEKGFGKSSIIYYIVQYNLANIYLETGQWEKAEATALLALDLEKQALGIEHNAFPMSLAQVGTIYLEQGELDKAEPYLTQAKPLRAQMLGMEHPHYAASLELLGRLHLARGDWAQARSYFEEEVYRLLLKQGERHPDVGGARLFLARSLFEQGELAQAAHQDTFALGIFRENFGNHHLSIMQSLDLLAAIFARQGKPTQAQARLAEALAVQDELLRNAADYASMREMEARMRYFDKEAAFLQTTAWRMEMGILRYWDIGKMDGLAGQENLADPPSPQPPDLAAASTFPGLIFDNALLHKGLLLKNSQEQLSAILAAQDTAVLRRYDEWKAARRRLAAEYAKAQNLRNGVQELENQANELERYLARHAAAFGKSKAEQVRWQAVQAALKPGEAAIEFVHLQVRNPVPADSAVYLAVVVRPEWQAPRLAYLCEQRQLDSLLQSSTSGDALADATVLYRKSRGIEGGGKMPSAQLRRLLWQPLDSLLTGVATIYFSPAGALHRIAFAAVPTGKSDSVLADKFNLVQLFSTRQLAVSAAKPNDGGASNPADVSVEPGTAVFFGGIDYENAALPPAADALAFNDVQVPRGNGKRNGWTFLEGSKMEVERLGDLFSRRKWHTILITGSAATEEQFKRIGTAGMAVPHVLHFATHGYFFPKPPKTGGQAAAETKLAASSVIPLSEHPLMRSGLLLAGGNLAWKEGKTAVGMEDGILTAYEVAQANLAGVKLATLSACETGLGDIQGSEGVMGLQRALKMAGVERLVVSLWEVPDVETAMFMEIFYKRWLDEGLPIRAAFLKAQGLMKTRYPDAAVWAAFVLVE